MEEKKRIRKEILAKRNGLSEGAVTEKTRKIKKTLFELSEFKKAKTVMFYVAKDKEVRTEEMIKEGLRMGKRVAVPVSRVEERDLVPSLLTDYGELVPGAYGILEPRGEHHRPISPKELDLIVVPGVVFDRRGNRIGFGGGFYDRFLRKVPSSVPRLGLAFDLQIVEGLPFGERDVPMDGVVTEEECFFIDRKV